MNHVEKLMQIHAERRQPMEVECYDFLVAEGINFLDYYFIQSKEEVSMLREDRYAFKVMSPKILHKSDFQAVRLGISKDGAEKVFDDLQVQFSSLDYRGVLAVPMAENGIELLLGSTFDDTFGLISVFGIGGTLVEILKDVTFGKSPLDPDDAMGMINSIRSQEMLDGPRGLPKLDRSEMADLMVKLSIIADKYNDLIKEIDLNPLRVTSRGIIPLDARIIFNPETC